MFMIMFVLDDPKKVDQVLDGWSKIGVRGATLLESTGAHRRRMRITGRYAFTTTGTEEHNITLMAIVNDEEIIERCLEETEKVTGDLTLPRTGIFSYWPLTFVKGIQKNYETE